MSDAIDAAWKVRDNAYCPYSKFKVGAALKSAKTGKIYAGCNVENAAFPTGICAERSAVCQAVAAEGPDVKFDHCIVVAATDTPTMPCGPCRQMMVEFGTETLVTSVMEGGNTFKVTLDELLPFSFGPHSLNIK